jgi:PAS domain S-box-containing protein
VRYAALADHRRLDGWPVFKAVFERHGGVAIPGVELFTRHDGREIHLLAYGFNPAHPRVLALLDATPTTRDAIQSIHDAGGIAILAHPLVLSRDPQIIETLIRDLREKGLDGIEAIYSLYDEADRRLLMDIADRCNLLISAGSDFHGPSFPAVTRPGMDLDPERWRRFRERLPAFRETPGRMADSPPPYSGEDMGRSDLRFLLRILLPALLAIGLFVAGLFAAVIPTIERNLMERKREMIRELTNSAWSILAGYEEDARAGRLKPDEARAKAREEIGRLRYGPEGKDYFWITDTHPRMVMHPWRADLDGIVLSDFTDPNGIRLFVEFVRLAVTEEHGYADYVWQWKDDPAHLAPKESYIRLFRPWGWIVGTGVYLEDVATEIDQITRGIVDLSFAIAIVVGLLLAYLIAQSYRIERRRRRAEADLRTAHDRYRLLVESSNQGTLLAIDGLCAYANRTLLEMAGRKVDELPFLAINDLLSGHGEEALEAPETPRRFETMLRRKDGTEIPVLVSPTRVEIAGRKGWILVMSEGARPATTSDVAATITGAEGPVTRRLPELVVALLETRAPVRRIGSIVTGVADAIVEERLTTLIEELGQPPIPFAFVAFGSGGREERTLVTDQDNGIVHADCDAATARRAEEYFASLATRICDDLGRAGYAYCRGEAMARDPKWRGPVAKWKRHFIHWIREPNPEEIMHFNVFFDIRAIHGAREPIEELRDHIATALKEAPAFFFHLAANALRDRPPLGVFGEIKTGDDSGLIDLKKALLPLVNITRLYALRHGVAATNTLDRLRSLAAAGIFDSETAKSLARACELIMTLRYQSQARSLIERRAADNRIDLNWLSGHEGSALQEALQRIEELRKKVVRDWPGAG